jgi:hypothetical protein
MDAKSARTIATNTLDILIKHQPNMLTSTENVRLDGGAVARFCRDFVEEYASYLLKRQES